MSLDILRRYNIEDLRIKRKEQWASFCKQCGICCYQKKFDFLHGYFTDFTSPCRYLDTVKKTCRVYNDRFKVCRACSKMTILHALFADFLPSTCGYVEKFRIWRKFSKRHLRSPGQNSNPENVSRTEYGQKDRDWF